MVNTADLPTGVRVDEDWIDEQVAGCVERRDGLWNQQTYLLTRAIRQLTLQVIALNAKLGKE